MPSPLKIAQRPAEKEEGGATVEAAIFATMVEVRMGIRGSAGIGTALARRDAKWAAARAAERPPEGHEHLPNRDLGLGVERGVFAVVSGRLAAWHAPGAQAKRLVYAQPLSDIAAVFDRPIDRKPLDSTPKARAIVLVHSDHTVLRLWAPDLGPMRKHLELFLSTLRARFE